MRSFDRLAAGFAPRTRARLILTLGRRHYRKVLAPLPKIVGPVLVVGSAPQSSLPVGVTPDWFLVSVNASQTVAAEFGFVEPDLTIFRDSLMIPGDYQDMMWPLLAGRRTKHLVSIVGSASDRNIAAHLPEKGYQAEKVTEIGRNVRGAVIAEATGRYLATLSGHDGVSNGIFAILLAYKLGASPVVMTGFSFSRPGWKQRPDIVATRPHLIGDTIACQMIRERNLPIYAADPTFAEEAGLRHWTGTTAT